MLVDMVLEKELRVLHLDPQKTEKACVHNGCSLSIGDFKFRPHSKLHTSTTRPNPLQQGHA